MPISNYFSTLYIDTGNLLLNPDVNLPSIVESLTDLLILFINIVKPFIQNYIKTSLKF